MSKTRLLVIIFSLSFALSTLGQKESVNPGINASYLKQALVVKEWIERLEAEGREVFQNREAIVQQLDLKEGMAVADIGAGTGAHLPYLSEAVSNTGKVYAVDIVPKFLEHIDQQAKENRWHNVETVLCTERSAMLPNNSIDLAFICNVYHHFEYPQDSLSSLHNALKTGGQLVLIDFKRIPGVSSDWILGHMRAGQEVFEQEITEAGFRKIEEVSDLLTDNYFVVFEKIN